MTQADVFKWVASAGLGGGFVAGENLPKKTGNLSKFKIFSIRVSRGFHSNRIVSSLIAALDQKPIRSSELRARQLKSLFEEEYKKCRHIIVVLHDAHLLSPSTIKHLKHFREIFDQSMPGIVLIGDMDILKRKINRYPEIYQRCVTIKDSGQMDAWPSPTSVG